MTSPCRVPTRSPLPALLLAACLLAPGAPSRLAAQAYSRFNHQGRLVVLDATHIELENTDDQGRSVDTDYLVDPNIQKENVHTGQQVIVQYREQGDRKFAIGIRAVVQLPAPVAPDAPARNWGTASLQNQPEPPLTPPPSTQYVSLQDQLTGQHQALMQDVGTQRAIVRRNRELLSESVRLNAANRKLLAEKKKLSEASASLEKQKAALEAFKPDIASAAATSTATAPPQ